MNETSQTAVDINEELPADLVELVTSIRKLPAEHREQVELLVNRVIDSTRRRRRILTLVQDALGQLRLDMKYLMFDLEATRRERDDFQAKLDD